MSGARQHPRFAIELEAEIRTGDLLVQGRTHDISRGGFCMLGKHPIEISTVCEVRLALVFSENQFSEQLTLPATIVWCTPLAGAFQIGARFGKLSESSCGYLNLFMRFLEGDDDDDRQEGTG